MTKLGHFQHEYMSYMAKKTQKRQTTIISLSDSNQQELENIKQQREQMLKEYQDKKQGKVPPSFHKQSTNLELRRIITTRQRMGC